MQLASLQHTFVSVAHNVHFVVFLYYQH